MGWGVRGKGLRGGRRKDEREICGWHIKGKKKFIIQKEIILKKKKLNQAEISQIS